MADDPTTFMLLASVLHKAAPGDFLVNMSHLAWRRHFGQLVKKCGLNPGRYKPYGLRRGGATSHYRKFGNMSKTIERGTWASVKAARIYVMESLAELRTIQRTPEQARKLLLGDKLFHKFLKGMS